MFQGSMVAIVTPMHADGSVDERSLAGLVDFHVENGTAAIVAVGTTGESPTLSWNEHNKTVETVAQKTKGKCLCIAGTGRHGRGQCPHPGTHGVSQLRWLEAFAVRRYPCPWCRRYSLLYATQDGDFALADRDSRRCGLPHANDEMIGLLPQGTRRGIREPGRTL